MSRIASILALTDEIETLISDGRWSEAAAREVERRNLLVEYVRVEGKGAKHLRELHARSVDSLEHVRRKQDSLAGETNRLIKNSRVVDAYLGNTAGGKARSNPR
jgi:hypothetical protein